MSGLVHGNVVRRTGDTMTGTLQINVATATDEALILKTTDDNSTKNILEIQKSDGTVLTNFTNNGSLRIDGAQTNPIALTGTTQKSVAVTSDDSNASLAVYGFKNTSGKQWALTSTSLSGGFTIRNNTDVYDNLYITATNGTWNIGKGIARQGLSQLRVTTATSTLVGLEVLGAASQTANLQEWQDSSGTVQALVDANGGAVFNEQGNNTDFRVETDTEPNFFVIDGGNENMRVGDTDTNYTEVDKAGDMIFVGGGGLAFAEIYAADANATITITSSGKANKVQITTFDTNGQSNNATPDHTNDHITITKAMKYLCTVSMHIMSVGPGGADSVGYSVYKNNGATEFTNLHGQRKLSGGGADEGSVSLSGIIDLAANDTIEVWIWNNDSTDDIVIDDINLSLVGIGG